MSCGTAVGHVVRTAVLAGHDGGEDGLRNFLPLAPSSELLRSHQVDLTRFGKGTASTLSQFYETVVLEEKCMLKVEDNRLFRMVELVRIILHFRNEEGHQRELRIKSEVTAGGQLRERNQPLAVVLRNDEHGGWESAVERCLSSKFGLSPAVQRACFNMPKDAYTYQENKGHSETIPGIPTKYKTHTIKMTVKDKSRSELLGIGLPEGKDFTTQVQGVQHWTWARVSNNKEEELMTLLQTYGLSLDQFSWQSFVDLYDEVYEAKHSKLEPLEGELVRSVRIIKVWLWANVLNCRHALVLRSKQQYSRTQVMTQLRVLSMRMAEEERWQDGLVNALSIKLGINEAMQREGLHVSEANVRQEVEYSRSFPGLKTIYRINEVHVEVINPQDQRWNHIGLPACHDFTFARQKQRAGEVDTVVARWGWINNSELDTEYAVINLGLRFGRLEHGFYFGREVVAEPAESGGSASLATEGCLFISLLERQGPLEEQVPGRKDEESEREASEPQGRTRSYEQPFLAFMALPLANPTVARGVGRGRGGGDLSATGSEDLRVHLPQRKPGGRAR
ncbi:Mitogen-activated protein kinase kinase kinase 3 [Durusdinium trenchii]|uniref:Mitogen-activated protein kinase kinase kinase 3 n=1 Tax=Durusdinium trenchii TaxID=1381693 RepID=A0ABP0SEJ2_9DINO